MIGRVATDFAKFEPVDSGLLSAAFLFWKPKGLQGLAAASRRALQLADCRRAALMRFIAYRDT
jgi:hypothetical protein